MVLFPEKYSLERYVQWSIYLAINKIDFIIRRKDFGVKRIAFDAIQGAAVNVDHYVYSPTIAGNPVDDGDIASLVDTTGTLIVALICPSSLPDQTSPIPNKQGDIDVDANGNIIEKPPIKIFTPTNLAPPVLSKKTRGPKAKNKTTKKKTTKENYKKEMILNK